MNRILLALWLAGTAWSGLPAAASAEAWTPAQQQVLRQYQAAELARQDSRTYVRVGRTDPANRAQGPYHIERTPARMAEAARLYADLVRDARAAFGPGHPQTAVMIDGFARLQDEQGIRLDLAEALYREALEIRSKALGPRSPEVADSLGELGGFYRETGRHGEAEACLKACLELRPAGPRAALARGALGLVYQDLGDYARAATLFQEALAIQKAMPSGQAEQVRTLTLLAALSVKQGDLDRCAALAGEALRLTEQPGSDATPGDRFSAGMLSALPDACRGQIVASGLKARKYFFSLLEKRDWAQYLAELNEDAYPAIIAQRTWANQGMAAMVETAGIQTRQTFGDHHPQLAAAQGNIALMHLARKEWTQAIAPAVQANAINFQFLPSVFAMASERLKLMYMEKTEGYRDLLLSAVAGARPEGPELTEALQWAMRLKGIVLDAMLGEREALRKGLDPGLRDACDQLRQARQELSGLFVKGPEADLDGFNARMAGLAARVDGLETRLSQGSAAYRENRELFSATPEAVRARLPQGSALVEYFAFNNYGEPGSPPWMLAFVLQAEGPAQPVMVDLGPAAPLEQAIGAWRRDLQGFAAGRGPEQAARLRLDGLGRKVAALLWDPVAARVDLARKRIVYLAPDGPVHLMPFAPLPSGSGYLIEQLDLAYVSTGKDFLRQRRPGAGAGALLVGGVDFDQSLPAPAAATDRGHGPSLRLDQLRWNPLSGTADEVGAIAAALAGADLPATVLEGGRAGLAAVSAGIQGARYVHLATHGFFLGDELGLDPHSRGLAVVGNRPAEQGPPLAAAPVFHRENPLLLSGLALAGANRSGGDGYLLAMDVANLDLGGADLVTLSSCETGLGEIRRGEGVFGLQRSFLIAGAQALVMSLWSVPDQETRDLMVDFYRQVAAGAPRRAAFRRSQLRMLRAGPARHPFFWAAFQYLGVE